MKILVTLFTCLFLSAGTVAQYSASFQINNLKYDLKPLKEPYVYGNSAHFAFVQQSGNRQYLRLAEMTTASPTPKAKVLKTLASYDTTDVYPGVVERIVDMSASPDNRYLLVYSLEEGYFASEVFFDHNITFYDMATGDIIGVTNEHSFASINRSNSNSDVYEDYVISTGVPAGEAASWDFAVETEGVVDAMPDWQWNDDGTLTIQMTFDVLDSFDDGVYLNFIGVDLFYQTFQISPSGLTSLGFGPPRAEASYPRRFLLAPTAGPAARIKFEGKNVLFPQKFSFRFGKRKFYETTKIATIVEGNIPRRYRLTRYLRSFDF